LLAPLGIRIPVFPVKGYSITLPLETDAEAPQVCLTDEARKMAFSRLGNRLRVAGTAELAGYDTSISEARCNALARRLQELFPKAGDVTRIERWAGLRPATPGNVPLGGIAVERDGDDFLNACDLLGCEPREHRGIAAAIRQAQVVLPDPLDQPLQNLAALDAYRPLRRRCWARYRANGA
jgi:hypothetical protein